jgi:hypothetical protein
MLNDAGILVGSAVGGLQNFLDFTTDTTQFGYPSYGTKSTSTEAFIDNFGTVYRSSAGVYKIDLAVRKEVGGFLDVVNASGNSVATQLEITQANASKTHGVSFDQEGGETDLVKGAVLAVDQGMYMGGGNLFTLGTATSKIVPGSGTNVNVVAGAIQISQDNTANYGVLEIQGAMSWTGGTFNCYINGTSGNQQDQLKVDNALTLGTSAHLSITANGGPNAGLDWYPVTYASRTGTLTFDSSGTYNIAYDDANGRIDISKKPSFLGTEAPSLDPGASAGERRDGSSRPYGRRGPARRDVGHGWEVSRRGHLPSDRE